MKSHAKLKLALSSLIYCVSFLSFSCFSQEKHDGRELIEIIEELGLKRREIIQWAKKVNPELQFSVSTPVDGLLRF